MRGHTIHCRTSELKPADYPEETSTYHEDFVKEPVTQHSEPVTGSPLPSQARDLRGNGRQVSKPGGEAMKGFLKKPSSQVQTAKVRLVGLVSINILKTRGNGGNML